MKDKPQDRWPFDPLQPGDGGPVADAPGAEERRK